MAVWGIIAEYHPFHNGHLHQINTIRKKDKKATVIAVMSGNFMQRGTPAIIDKWLRTAMALAGGVDLVLELPAVFAVQAADFFARGGVSVLAQMQVNHLCFGSEAGDTIDFLKNAQLYLENEAAIFEKVRSYSKKMPYPEQLEKAWSAVVPEGTIDLAEPNNLLGFAYAKEVLRQEVLMTVEPVKRLVSHHHEQVVTEEAHISSGQAIRESLMAGRAVDQVVPSATEKILSQWLTHYLSWTDFWPYLKYEILTSPTRSLKSIYQMTQGLEYLLKKEIKQANSYQDFLNRIKTRTYTQARLERLLVYVLLKWRADTVKKELNQSAPLRVLGFSHRGQAHLKYLKQKHNVRPDTIIGRDATQKYARDIAAGEIYRLADPKQLSLQDYTKKPLQKY